MKALISIVILIVIGWGIWWFANRNDVDDAADQPAAAAKGINFGADVSGEVDTSSDDAGPYEDKG